MNVLTLVVYMEMCDACGLTPSFEGLKEYNTLFKVPLKLNNKDDKFNL